jgi:hypothetical protein
MDGYSITSTIAVCLCDGLSKSALLLGGRQSGDQVDPVVNQFVVLGPDWKSGVIAEGEVLGFDIGQSDSAASWSRHGLCSLHRRHISLTHIALQLASNASINISPCNSQVTQVSVPWCDRVLAFVAEPRPLSA